MNRMIGGALFGVIVAAGGFAGGVQVQKNKGTTATASAAGFPGGAGGGPPQMQQTSADGSTAGTVTYTKGEVLYVKDQAGNTVKVKLKSSADVTRTAVTDGDEIQPGDSVVIQGATAKSGTVTATTVTATDG